VASRIGWVINIELVAFGSLPFMASLMARGVGLPG
jgi:putative membrane protein